MAKPGVKYKPTDADREFVRRAVTAGTNIEDIAQALNLHDDTLRKYFRYEILTAREVLKGKAVKVLEDQLTDGSLDAAKFVLVRVAGWRDRSDIDLSSKDGTMSPQRIEIVAADASSADKATG